MKTARKSDLKNMSSFLLSFEG